MAGRNRISRHPMDNDPRDLRRGPRVMIQGPGPIRTHPREELEIRDREMRRLFSENQRLMDDCRKLRREVDVEQLELNKLGPVIPLLRAEKESAHREFIQRASKMESEVRATELLRAEVMQLRAEIQNVKDHRQELYAQVQGLTQDISRINAENKHIQKMKSELDLAHQELLHTREAFEYEKKAQEELLQHKQAMEPQLLSLARDIEKLGMELSTKRMRETGAGYGLPKVGSGSAYGDIYGGAWGAGAGAYDKYGPSRY